MKKVKVKNLAEKYAVPIEKIIKALKSKGIKATSASSVVPAGMLELVETHFDEMFKGKTAANDEVSPDETAEAGNREEIHMKTPIVVKALAEALDKKAHEVVSKLMSMNILASINQSIETDAAIKLAESYNVDLILDRREKEEHKKNQEEEILEEELQDNPEDLKDRPPVVTFLGHVDHGKTSLQDCIRKTSVTDGEAGGITQHIGASVVEINGKQITFVDTPGHEAFTQMRERGANVTDIAILVVAADDGFMPQTLEALKHARAADVPIIVAVNKTDLANADIDKVIRQMQENSLMSEDWGGEVGTIKVSAKTGDGINELLERIILESEMLELKANPNKLATAVVLEAQLEQGLGSTANVIVKSGTLKIGDFILCGKHYGKVKTMVDAHGKRVIKAGPSMPVKLVGLSGVPEAGAIIKSCKSEKEARSIAERYESDSRQEELQINSATSLEDLFAQIDDDKRNDLNIIIKSDVKGSGEAIADSLKKLPSEKIQVNIVLNAVGAITENDVMLASASGSILVGFHTRVNPGVNALAAKQKVQIRLYSIIYELLQDITESLTGMLAPDKREKSLGSAKILQIFSVSKGPNVCGCMVEKGAVKIGTKARVHRNKELIYNGEVSSLRRFQDNVKEVRQGLECGIRLDNFMDFVEGDIIEFYDIELHKATL